MTDRDQINEWEGEGGSLRPKRTWALSQDFGEALVHSIGTMLGLSYDEFEKRHAGLLHSDYSDIEKRLMGHYASGGLVGACGDKVGPMFYGVAHSGGISGLRRGEIPAILMRGRTITGRMPEPPDEQRLNYTNITINVRSGTDEAMAKDEKHRELIRQIMHSTVADMQRLDKRPLPDPRGSFEAEWIRPPDTIVLNKRAYDLLQKRMPRFLWLVHLRVFVRRLREGYSVRESWSFGWECVDQLKDRRK